MKKNNLKIISLFIIIFLVLFILVLTDNSGAIDDFFYNKIILLRSDFFDVFFKTITSIGNSKSIIVILLILNIILKKKDSVTMDVLVLTNVGVNQLIKNIIRRDRPLHKLISIGGYSFPSGHAMISITLFGYLLYLVTTRINRRKLRIFLQILLSCLIFLICISRIYLGVHYATDVICGFILGFLELIFIINFEPNISKVVE